MKTKFWILAGLAISLGLASMSAKAIPTFARKTGMACSGCHYAVPSLNAMGRQFKMNGFRLAPDVKPAKKFNDYLNLDKSFPIAAAFVSRPYEKVKGGKTNIRAINELEFYVAGSFGQDWSGFMELAGAPGEGVGVDHGQVTYSMSPEVNFQVAWGPTFWSDPYDTLTHMRRLTIGQSSVIGSEFGGADGPTGENRAYIKINGRIANSLYYSVGFGSQIDNTSGADPKTLIGRLAYDFTQNIMLGAFIIDGKCTVASASDFCLLADRNYTREGIDFQADFNNFRFTGVYLHAKDDDELGLTSETNDALTGRATYTIVQNGRPVWVPYLQVDNHELKNGAESITDTTIGLIHFFDENIKATLEYTDTKGDGTTPDDTQFALQLAAYF